MKKCIPALLICLLAGLLAGCGTDGPASSGMAPGTDLVSGVEMLDEGLERGAYRHSTQGWMKPCKPLPQFLKEFSLAGGTHHSALVYDANIEEIKAFGTMMGFEVIEIK